MRFTCDRHFVAVPGAQVMLALIGHEFLMKQGIIPRPLTPAE
jgi:hypothetical protein